MPHYTNRDDQEWLRTLRGTYRHFTDSHEERVFFQALKQIGPENPRYDELCWEVALRHVRVVARVARQYHFGGIDFQDLVKEGLIGAKKSGHEVRRYARREVRYLRIVVDPCVHHVMVTRRRLHRLCASSRTDDRSIAPSGPTETTVRPSPRRRVRVEQLCVRSLCRA